MLQTQQRPKKAKLKRSSSKLDLGPLQMLLGQWKSTGGTGWNMIAVPFADGPSKYRLLLNQYDETLTFSVAGEDVVNRAIEKDDSGQTTETDQSLAAVGYVQDIVQVDATDLPRSELAGSKDLKIHHEPGMWLWIREPRTDAFDIARMATIPHGDAVLAMGTSATVEGPPDIPELEGLPVGITDELDSSAYLAPYREFKEQPFNGKFDPTRPSEPLRHANQDVDIVRTTVLPVSTDSGSGGLVNTPLIVRQANATQMTATLWIQELATCDARGRPRLRLQYAQVVMLDFFPRNDGKPGRIRWPHVSVNTLCKVSDDEQASM
ncbi:MAG: heme-binding protein, partial [Myxococcota bacterium]